MMAHRLWLLFVSFAPILLVQGLYEEFDSWCGSRTTSSVLVGNKIYYDYGYVWLRKGINGLMIIENNPYLWALDLSSEFNASKISEDFKLSSIPQLTGYKKSVEIPTVGNGIMWASRDGTIYETGGYIYDVEDYFVPEIVVQTPMTRRRAVWSFNSTTREWALVQTSGETIDRVSHAAYASAPDLGLHFAVGGATSIQHQSENINYPGFWSGTVNNGMTIFNSGSLTLRNRTLEDLALETNTMPARKEGWCKHIPVGAKGMLVCHARSTGPPNGELIADIEDSPVYEYSLNWTDYQTVDIYDIAKDKWHFQSTSTEEPIFPPFYLSGCAALAGDGTSWEIYMQGHSSYDSPRTTTQYENQQDIWVLTIPAFHWFRIPTSRSRRPLTGHGCQVLGKQLITVSGREISLVGSSETNRTDEEKLCTNSPFRVFDFERLEWTDYFVPGKYAPPKVVANYVKDPARNKPRFGWSSPEVEDILRDSGSGTATSSSPGPTSSSPVPSEEPSEKDHRGAIAGGVAGGVVAIIAAVVLFIYFKRRGTPDDTVGGGGPPVGIMPVPGYLEKYHSGMPVNQSTAY